MTAARRASALTARARAGGARLAAVGALALGTLATPARPADAQGRAPATTGDVGPPPARPRERDGARGRSIAAATARDLVAEGRRRYVDLDFGGAVEVLERALASTDVPDVLRVEALEYLGACYVVLERPDRATLAFRELLDIDPHHLLREPTGSPKIARLFERLRAEVAPDAALDPDVRAALDVPNTLWVGSRASVVVRVAGAGEDAGVTVRLRGEPGTAPDAWRAVPAERTGSGRFVATFTAPDEPATLDVYAEVRDGAGRLVARAASPISPRTVEVLARPPPVAAPRPWEQWWFWTALGVAVVGASVGIAVAASRSGEIPAGTLPPGRVELP